MTKGERLQELKSQDKFYKVLDKYFDAGWRDFVNEIWKKNDISNIRVFKILAAIKGEDFVSDLIGLMKVLKKQHAYLQFTRKPKGIIMKDGRFKTIPEIQIDKHPSGQYNDCTVYIQFKSDRWIKFIF